MIPACFLVCSAAGTLLVETPATASLNGVAMAHADKDPSRPYFQELTTGDVLEVRAGKSIVHWRLAENDSLALMSVPSRGTIRDLTTQHALSVGASFGPWDDQLFSLRETDGHCAPLRMYYSSPKPRPHGAFRIVDRDPPGQQAYDHNGPPPPIIYTDVRPNLDRQEVLSVIRENTPALLGCLPGHRDSQMPAKLLVKFIITPNGRTVSQQVPDEKSWGTRVSACVVHVLRGLQFPAYQTESGNIPVSLPITIAQ
jgi:hypothetical protein